MDVDEDDDDDEEKGAIGILKLNSGKQIVDGHVHTGKYVRAVYLPSGVKYMYSPAADTKDPRCR